MTKQEQRKREVERKRNMAEFRVIKDQVARNRDGFIQRLEANIVTVPNARLGTPCRIWTGNHQKNGYPRINFRYAGKVEQMRVHRLFLILMLRRPIRTGYEAAHECHTRSCCSHVQEQTHTYNLGQRDGRQETDVPF